MLNKDKVNWWVTTAIISNKLITKLTNGTHGVDTNLIGSAIGNIFSGYIDDDI